MSNIFKDQRKFMLVSGQDVDKYNEDQYTLYLNLIKEEFEELQEAVKDNDRVEQLDAALDIITVCAGFLHSFGCDAEGAWNEVVRSNMSKINPETGKVLKREDGKIIKPSDWSPPDLSKFIK